MNRHVFKLRVLGVLMVAAVLAGFSAAVMLLWNALMPDLFGLPLLRYGQAAGLTVLCRILIGGMPFGHAAHRGFGPDGRDFARANRLREKWMNMSDEERIAFIGKEKDFRHFMRDRFSQHHRFSDDERLTKDAPPKGDCNE
ncbi:MAG: hypothetical protein LBB61_08425 [Treponema sp.]|jgi:hypothetical protein|nr:hypothetical protein [Treponema sp.]